MSDNPKFETWCCLAKSAITMDGKPLPLVTELLYKVCNDDPKKFDRALAMLRAAFEAGEKAAAPVKEGQS
jgi:hypothetical protein